MDNEKAIRAAKLTLGGILEKRRAKAAVERAQGQIAPSKYLPDVPRQVHANGGYVPTASLPIPKLAVAAPIQTGRQPGVLDVLGSLASLGKSARSITDLVSPEKEEAAPEPHASRAEPHEGGLTPEATAAMEALRKGWTGADFGIVSGYRTPEQNRAAKGAKDSQHIHGNAFDVDTTGWSPEDKLALADAAWDAGFRGFGFYDNNMHFDVGGSRAWGPSHSRDSIPEWAQGWAQQRYGYAGGGRVAFQSGNHPEVPDVLYHGTSADFKSFLPLSHFGTQKAANERIQQTSGENKSVIPVHISMKKPLDLGVEAHPYVANENWLDDADMLWQVHRVLKANGHQDAADKIEAAANDAMDNNGLTDETRAAAANAIRSAGYDGLMYTNKVEDRGSRSFVALGPEQVKSAISARKFDPANPDMTFAEGGEVTDLGQVREQKQLQTYHTGMMDDIHQRMSNAMQAHEKAVDAGVFDGYEVGDMLQGSAHPMRITGRYMQKWKPTPFAMRSFERMGTQPTIIEHEGEQYIPMLRYQTGKEGMEGWQEGSAYLDGIKAAGYQKMGGLRAVKAAGGAVYTPQKTVKAYKLFRTKGDGKLYPLFVHADKPVPMGEWLEAEEGPQGKAEGKVKSKLGDLAYRPGWHAGDLPMATHIGGKSDPSLKKPDYRPDNHVWAEVEMAADKDWQSVANSRGKGAKAHITDQVPYGGFYRYKTNPNMTGNWLIGGHMKVNRVLPDEEVKAINDAAGTADLPRRSEGFAAGGAAMFEGIHEDLQDEQGNPLELWHGTPGEGFSEFKDEKLGSTRDYGFYGRGHYLTPDQENASEYAGSHADEGTLMGPLHAALKNPYIWDASEQGAHRTLRDLQSMGIMKGQDRLEAWDNLQRHHIDPFMREMQKRGHDGVIVRTNDYTGEKPHKVSEVVVFKPSAIKHKDAERFDPNDPNIYHARGGVAK